MKNKLFRPEGLSVPIFFTLMVLSACGNQGPAFTEELGKTSETANAEVSDAPIIPPGADNGDLDTIDNEIIDEGVAPANTDIPDFATNPPNSADGTVNNASSESNANTGSGGNASTAGTGGTGNSSATFYQCDNVNPDSRAIFVKAYEIASYESVVNDDFVANIINLGGGVLNYNNLKFIKENFNTTEVLNQNRFLTSFCMLNFAVSPRTFTDGFPSSGKTGEILSTIEWFALDAIADLDVPADGSYQFQIQSDDGAILYLDGTNVLDNDGRHHPIKKQSQNIFLNKGKHRVVVHYFQGPRYEIALELYWKKPGLSSFAIIPPESFKYVKP